MPFIDDAFFWGGFLLFLGIIILLQTFFKINVPLFKVALGIYLIYSGLVLLFAPKLSLCKKKCSIINVDFNRHHGDGDDN